MLPYVRGPKGQQEEAIARAYAEKVNFLFATFRKIGGDPYSYREVERLSGNKISNGSLSRLAEAKIVRPNKRTLQALTNFFGLQDDFWTQPLNEALKSEVIKHEEDRKHIAALARDLDPASAAAVIGIMERLKRRSNDTPPTLDI